MENKLLVFLNHASEDKVKVQELSEKLGADGFDPWLDEERILSGQDAGLEIEKALRASDIILLCFSTRSIAKEGYIQHEYECAMRYQKEKPEGTIYVIPVRLDGSEIPAELNNLQHVDYPGEYDRLLMALNIRAEEIAAKDSVVSKANQKKSTLPPHKSARASSDSDGPNYTFKGPVTTDQFIGRDQYNFTQIIKQPSLWQKAIWEFLSKNQLFIVAWFFFQIVIAFGYLHFKNLYQIPLWKELLAAFLFTIFSWGIYTWIREKHSSSWNISATGVAALLFVGLLGWQTWQIFFPERFAPQVFAIAVAELDEGTILQPTGKAKEISDQVYEHLCSAIKDDFRSGTTIDPCGDPNASSEVSPIQVRRIGVIPDSVTARDFGDRIRADVVIWGQILSSTGQGVTIRFQVLETFDRAVSPDIPIVLPVKTQYTEIYIDELDFKSDPQQYKDTIVKQSNLISSFVLGLAAYLDGDFQQAIQDFEIAANTAEYPALTVSPEGKSLIYFYLGRSDHAIGRLVDGQEWLLHAQEINPSEPGIPIGLAIGYGGQGLDEERDTQLRLALDSVNVWLETNPNDNVGYYDKALIYHIRKEYDNAITIYRSILDRDPDYYVAYITLGQVSTELENYDIAENAYRDAIALADRSGVNPAWAYLNLALMYQKAGEVSEAKTAFMQARDSSPNIDRIYFYYASFLEEQQETDAALLSYKKLLEVTRDKGWGYSILANYYKDPAHQNLNKALENYKQAVLFKPKDSLLRTYLAEIYFELGHTDDARREFETAINLDASYYSFASYGEFLLHLNEFESAAQMYQESLRRRPDDYSVLLRLGITYERLGETDKAARVYRQIVSMKDQLTEEKIRDAENRLRAIEKGSQP